MERGGERGASCGSLVRRGGLSEFQRRADFLENMDYARNSGIGRGGARCASLVQKNGRRTPGRLDDRLAEERGETSADRQRSLKASGKKSSIEGPGSPRRGGRSSWVISAEDQKRGRESTIWRGNGKKVKREMGREVALHSRNPFLVMKYRGTRTRLETPQKTRAGTEKKEDQQGGRWNTKLTRIQVPGNRNGNLLAEWGVG